MDPNRLELVAIKLAAGAKVGSGYLHSAFVPGTTRVLRTGARSLIEWDPFQGTVLTEYPGNASDSPSAIAVAADGKTAMVGFREGAVRFVDLARKKTLSFVRGQHHWPVAVAALPGGGYVSLADEKLLFWEAGGKKPLQKVKTGGSFSVAVAPDGTVAMAGIPTATLLRPGAKKALPLPSGKDGRILMVSLTPDGERVVGIDGAGEVFVWKTSTGKTLRSWKHGIKGAERLFLAAVSSGRAVICDGGSKGHAMGLFDLDPGKEIAHIDFKAVADAFSGIMLDEDPAWSAEAVVLDRHQLVRLLP